MIRIWKLRDAPQHLKTLAPQVPGDIWVLEAPEAMAAEVEELLRTTSLRLTILSRHELPDGTVIMFGQNKAEMKQNAP